MKIKTMEFDDSANGSYFPPVGRYHLAGFDYDSSEVYAVIVYHPNRSRTDGVSTLDSYSHISLRCDNQHLAALHDALPDGDERNYLAAIHDAVDALNGINLSMGEAMRLAQRPATLGQFNDAAFESPRLYADMLHDAIGRLQNFDDGGPEAGDKKYAFLPPGPAL